MDRERVEALARLVASQRSRRAALLTLAGALLLGVTPDPASAGCRHKEGRAKRRCRRRKRRHNDHHQHNHHQNHHQNHRGHCRECANYFCPEPAKGGCGAGSHAACVCALPVQGPCDCMQPLCGIPCAGDADCDNEYGTGWRCITCPQTASGACEGTFCWPQCETPIGGHVATRVQAD